MTPLGKLIAGIVSGVICLGFVLLAHWVGLELEKWLETGLIIGGATSAGVSIWGAKQMPNEQGKG